MDTSARDVSNTRERSYTVKLTDPSPVSAASAAATSARLGAHLGRRGAGLAAAVGVSGVGAGDGVAEIPFDPGPGGVPYPVHADLLGADPGQVPADAGPQVVIPAGGDRAPAGVPQQLPVWRGVPLLAVLDQAGHQGGGDRLPSDRFAFPAAGSGTG